ncbi:MAG: tRNA lysidine(34) synthetase TilS [Desulfobulbaceae bacterium]
MHPLERLTLEAIRHDALLSPDDAVLVVAVSGGPDSTALLQVLARLRTELGFSLVAVYVDHGLRPVEAVQEAEQVRDLAHRLAAGCEIIPVDVRSMARAGRLSLEHAARELRYQVLREAAARNGARTIAVAHTADDQAEEILIRLLRGGGRMALSGMRRRRGEIIRPFLHIEKKKILGYLQDMELRWCEDSMNNDMRYLRNRVRHRLLPYLEEQFDRGVRRALRKVADCLAEDETLLDGLAEEALGEVVVSPSSAEPGSTARILIRRALLAAKPKALQRRVIEKLLWQIGGSASYDHILKIIDAVGGGRTGSELHLGGGLRCGVQREYLELLFPRGKRPWRGRLYPPRQSDENSNSEGGG